MYKQTRYVHVPGLLPLFTNSKTVVTSQVPILEKQLRVPLARRSSVQSPFSQWRPLRM